MISLTHTSKSYTDRTLWSNFHYTITSWSKIALIWLNGCGKSTMLACITGRDSVDAWSIISKWLIAQIPQEIEDKYLNFTIEEYRYQYLPSHDELYLWHIAMDEWWVEFDITIQLRSLSGGQRKIIQLMTLSFQSYDIIVLDEPTNHLDIQMKNHLSDYLSSTKSTVICVTHDRHFINSRATQVRNRDGGQIITYPWDYDDYLILREQAQLAQQRAHESVAKELERQQAVLAEFKRRSKMSSDPKRGKMMRTRSNIITRMQDRQVDQVIKTKDITLTAISHTRTGKELCKIKHMDVVIAWRTLISDINFTIHTGDKIAILWPNGCGKTTFVKELITKFWELMWDNNTDKSIELKRDFERRYIDQLNSQIQWTTKVLDRYIQHCPWHMPDSVAINQLMQFRFSHGQMQQSIDSSSYGQKLKLKILTSIKSAIDMLILDEPTNHLDIVTIEALERMISEYPWAVIMISHDPYFIANCEINTIYNIQNCKLVQEVV